MKPSSPCIGLLLIAVSAVSGVTACSEGPEHGATETVFRLAVETVVMELSPNPGRVRVDVRPIGVDFDTRSDTPTEGFVEIAPALAVRRQAVLAAMDLDLGDVAKGSQCWAVPFAFVVEPHPDAPNAEPDSFGFDAMARWQRQCRGPHRGTDVAFSPPRILDDGRVRYRVATYGRGCARTWDVDIDNRTHQAVMKRISDLCT